MKAEHGGNIYAASRDSQQKEAIWLDYSANINPLGLAPSVKAAMLQAIDSVIHYPDADAYDLKRAICRAYGISSELITVGNGAVELLYVLSHIIQPHKVLVMAPTFSEYERAACSSGAQVSYYVLHAHDDFKVKSTALIDQIEMSQPELVFLCNPNNPTGVLMPPAEIAEVIAAAAKIKSFVVIDESFLDFLHWNVWTCQPLLSKFSNLIIAHSLTKFYAIPGLRLGFVLASEIMTRKLHLSKDPWNVNSIAQAAGVAALGDEVYAEQSRTYITQEKKFFYQSLGKISGLKPYEPAANYILVDIRQSPWTASALRQKMMEQKILIRDCSNYEGLGDDYIRLAVKSHEQNEQVLQVLQNIMKGELL
jgi:threonine-phosphate decarboxylase